IDADGDQYGLSSVVSCFRPVNGFLVSELLGINDCNDVFAYINPETVWYIDADGDQYGLSSVVSCFRPVNCFLASELLGINDCYDADANEYPGQTWYIDADGDSYYTPEISCTRPINGWLISEISPLGTSDCGPTDPIVTNQDQIWYIDADGDRYGLDNSKVESCTRPANGFLYSELLGTNDCDDTDIAKINSDFIEIYGDGIDNNCNGQIDETQVGQRREGGVVFYVSPPGQSQYALVSSLSDEGWTQIWQNKYTLIAFFKFNHYVNGTSTLMGTGKTNTDKIIEELRIGSYNNGNFAAKSAREYHNAGGYTDWFLPSKNELNQLYIQKDILESVSGFNNFKQAYYWSSSEVNADKAWAQYFGPTTFKTERVKDEEIFIRPVRVFLTNN
ncbi:MAG: DUF1566 domain-containing protein, partial [Flavobacteriaceae bacterium]|nr:DUF1566 domain-containing protein [Flavobacteriaceae bacterium]